MLLLTRTFLAHSAPCTIWGEEEGRRDYDKVVIHSSWTLHPPFSPSLPYFVNKVCLLTAACKVCGLLPSWHWCLTFLSERNCIPHATCVAILSRSRDVGFRWMGGLSLPGRTVYIFSWPLVDLRNPSRSPWDMYSIIIYIGPLGRGRRRRRRRRQENWSCKCNGFTWVENGWVDTHFQQCRLWSTQPHWGVALVGPAPPSPAAVQSHTHHRQCNHLWVRKPLDTVDREIFIVKNISLMACNDEMKICQRRIINQYWNLVYWRNAAVVHEIHVWSSRPSWNAV